MIKTHFPNEIDLKLKSLFRVSEHIMPCNMIKSFQSGVVLLVKEQEEKETKSKTATKLS